MDNSQMKAGRFLRLQRYKNRFNFIISNLEAGNTVYVHTAIGATKYSAKHAGYFSQSKNGVFVQSGKRTLCIDINTITAHNRQGARVASFPIF